MKTTDGRLQRRQRGGALLLVLCVSMLLALLVASGAALMRADLVAARADGLVMVDLTAARNAATASTVTSQVEDDGQREIVIGGSTYTVRQQGPTALQLLNAATAEQLASYLSPLVGKEGADPAAFALVDWRDADDLLSDASGAVGDTERGAANRPFLTPGEAAAVIGLDREELICVLSRSSDADENSTPRLMPGRTITTELAASDGNGPVHLVRTRYAGGRVGDLTISHVRRYGTNEPSCDAIGAEGAAEAKAGP